MVMTEVPQLFTRICTLPFLSSAGFPSSPMIRSATAPFDTLHVPAADELEVTSRAKKSLTASAESFLWKSL